MPQTDATAATQELEADELEASWGDDRDLYRVLLTGSAARVRARVWYLSYRRPQLIWRRRYVSAQAATEDCEQLIAEEQAKFAGGRPAAITWIHNVAGVRGDQR